MDRTYIGHPIDVNIPNGLLYLSSEFFIYDVAAGNWKVWLFVVTLLVSIIVIISISIISPHLGLN